MPSGHPGKLVGREHFDLHVFSDSSLIVHPDAKTKEWTPDVEPIWQYLNDALPEHAGLVLHACGGARATDYVAMVEMANGIVEPPIAKRSGHEGIHSGAARTASGGDLTGDRRATIPETSGSRHLKIAVVWWSANDCSTMNKQKGGQLYKVAKQTDIDYESAPKLRSLLEQHYDAGFIIGPGAAETWRIESQWDVSNRRSSTLTLQSASGAASPARRMDGTRGPTTPMCTDASRA